MSALIILDDRDAAIVYSSGWHQGGTSTEYNDTTTYTFNAGATATLTFQGVGIAVYGTVGSTRSNETAPESSYQLDDNKLFALQPYGLAPQQRRLFYQSPQLSQAQHTLVVTRVINGSTPFILDYFAITTNDTSFLTLSDTATLSSSSGTATSSSSSRGTSTTFISSSSSRATLTSSDISVIAGSVVGGVVACVLLTFWLMCFWGRRKRKLEDDRNVYVFNPCHLNNISLDALSSKSNPFASEQEYARQSIKEVSRERKSQIASKYILEIK